MCIIELHPGQGGADAEHFAASLADSVRAWARNNGVRVQDQSPIRRPRTRLVTVTLPGYPAAPVVWLAGQHRIQHVPKGTQRQTSYVELVVLDDHGQPPRTDLTAHDPDVRVDTHRGTGPGGQHKNTSDTAVTVTHRPTGITVTRNSGRSQSGNLDSALAELSARVAARASARVIEARNATRREQAAPEVTFSRSAFLGQVRHEPTGARWTLRQWDRGQFAEPSTAAARAS